ncbi:MAG: carboxymuconolactone decarboxylase family protein [Phycisphaerales bacterium]|nr:carboxymuconolactone decarboxylase family protein [Phycisphaerales bacterium]
MTDDRSKRGAETLAKIHGDGGWAKGVAALDEIAPGFKEMLQNFAFGEVYSREGLDIKYRQLATVAVLTVKDTAPNELRAHLRGALRLGWSKRELAEVILQQVLYAGFPAVIHALTIAREVFAEPDAAGKPAG